MSQAGGPFRCFGVDVEEEDPDGRRAWPCFLKGESDGAARQSGYGDAQPDQGPARGGQGPGGALIQGRERDGFRGERRGGPESRHWAE